MQGKGAVSPDGFSGDEKKGFTEEMMVVEPETSSLGIIPNVAESQQCLNHIDPSSISEAVDFRVLLFGQTYIRHPTIGSRSREPSFPARSRRMDPGK